MRLTRSIKSPFVLLIAFFAFSFFQGSCYADTKAETTYVSIMTSKMGPIGGTILKFSSLIKDPHTGGKGWSRQLDAYCDKLSSYPPEIQKVNVPPRYRVAHAHLLTALRAYAYVGAHLPRALSAQDVAEGARCRQLLSLADNEFSAAQQAYQAAGVRN